MPGDYCQNCGDNTRFLPLFAPPRATWRCERCGGWTYVGPVEGTPEQLYDSRYFFGGEYADYDVSSAAQRRNFARKLEWLERAGCGIRAGARVLEVGCATGEFLALLATLPRVSALGIEVSEFCRQRARERGLSVHAPDDPALQDALAALRPDFIVAWDVWEHLSHPANVFQDHLAAAAPDVVLAISTVDAGSAVARVRGERWRQFHPPTHLQYPTRRSLRHFCSERSLDVALQRSFGYHRPLLEYVQALGVEVPEAVPAPVRALPLYLNLWDTQLIVARRRA